MNYCLPVQDASGKYIVLSSGINLCFGEFTDVMERIQKQVEKCGERFLSFDIKDTGSFMSNGPRYLAYYKNIFLRVPEATIPPNKLKKFVDDVICAQKNGAIIYITTNSYLLLKYFDLRCKPDTELMFISFYGSGRVYMAKRYKDIERNIIDDVYGELVTEEIRRDSNNGLQIRI